MDKQILNSNILKEFIADDYLNYENLANIKNTYSKNYPKSIRLDRFFKEDKYNLLQKEIFSQRFKKISSPMECSFSTAEISDEFKKLINSQEFKDLIEFITGKKLQNHKSNCICIGHKNYTLLKDDFNEEFLEINFFFSGWKQEFGGYFSYFKNEELLRIIPSENSVTFVNIGDKIQNFIKYINVNSQLRKVFLINLKIREIL